ncbi:hypothetical protein Plhal304r1_c040g0117501 [Plasmopara halstedii]
MYEYIRNLYIILRLRLFPFFLPYRACCSDHTCTDSSIPCRQQKVKQTFT